MIISKYIIALWEKWIKEVNYIIINDKFIFYNYIMIVEMSADQMKE